MANTGSDDPLISNDDLHHYTEDKTGVVHGDERDKFTKHSALVTLLLMCIGPLTTLIQVTAETLDMWEATVAFKDRPDAKVATLYGFCNAVVQTTIYLGLYFYQVITCVVPKLIGEGEHEKATQATVDCYRGSFLLGMIFPIGFYFCIRPFLRFVGCTEDLLEEGVYFVLPPTVGMFVVMWFNLTIAFFLSIGSPGFSALTRIIGNSLQSGFYTPILLFALHCSTRFIRLPMILSQATLELVAIPLIFSGKFSIKPHLNMLFKPFTKEFFRGLLLGLPVIFQYLCVVLPPTLILNSMTKNIPEDKDPIGSSFGVNNRLLSYANGFQLIFTMALITVGSEAYGSKSYKRMFKYFGWALLFMLIICSILEPFLVLKPEWFSKIFLHDPHEIEVSKKIIPVPNYSLIAQPLNNGMNALLVIMRYPLLALFVQALQMIFLCVGSKVLPIIFKDDPYKIMLIYPITDFTLVFAYLIMLIYPLVKLRKQIREDKERLLINTVNRDKFN